MGKVIRTLWVAVATLALYDEANRAGFFNKMKPHFEKLREKICPNQEKEV